MSITGAGGGKVQRMRMVSTLRGGIHGGHVEALLLLHHTYR